MCSPSPVSSEQDINTRRLVMFRVLTILSAVVALAVSPAPALAICDDPFFFDVNAVKAEKPSPVGLNTSGATTR
jgi:hypothetical protein